MEVLKDFLADYYLWTKSLHLIAVMSWMAGLLYLPRLFVYHVAAPIGSSENETFKVMEYRLQRFIMTPAMITTFVLGFLLMLTPGVLVKPMGWFHAKFFLVILMAGSQGFMGKWRKAFAADQNTKSAKFFRVANEVPTVLMIFIIFLVVVKPF